MYELRYNECMNYDTMNVWITIQWMTIQWITIQWMYELRYNECPPARLWSFSHSLFFSFFLSLYPSLSLSIPLSLSLSHSLTLSLSLSLSLCACISPFLSPFLFLPFSLSPSFFLPTGNIHFIFGRAHSLHVEQRRISVSNSPFLIENRALLIEYTGLFW